MDLSFIWFIAVVGGTAVLGIVIAYIMLTRSGLTREEEARHDLGTRRIYEEEDRKPD